MSLFGESLGRKLKGKSSTSSSSSISKDVPSFRFNKADEEIFQILDDDSSPTTPALNVSHVLVSHSNLGYSNHDQEEFMDSQNDNHSEAIEPETSSRRESKNMDIPQPSSHSPPTTPPMSSSSSAESTSFLNQFKKNIREKFKNEKEKWQQKQQMQQPLISSTSLDLSSSDLFSESGSLLSKALDLDEDSFFESKLSHSMSENVLSPPPMDKEEVTTSKDTEGEEKEEEECLTKNIDDDTETKIINNSQIESTPQKDSIKRGKFNFSFRSSPLRAQSQECDNEVIQDIGTPSKSSTAILQKIMGLGTKSQPSSSPVSMKQLSECRDYDDDKFTELKLEDDYDDNIERAIEADESFNSYMCEMPQNFKPLKFPIKPPLPEDLRKNISPPSPSSYFSFLSKFRLASVLPFLIILLVQVLPVPCWLTGFITGVLISIPAAFYLSVKLFQDSDMISSSPEPKENLVQMRQVSLQYVNPSSILIDEDMEKKSVWMNIWPSKYGVYDPATYDVRWTVSVLVELYGYWIELRFPRRNIPLRRMHDEAEPDFTSMTFFEHQVIDLTTAEISLLPENLPAKWKWSKKYPIQIKTHSRKLNESGDSSLKEEKKLSVAECNDKGDCDNCDILEEDGEKEDDKLEVEDSRTFYLFARTGREKEEWYSRLRAGASFLKDWHHQNPSLSTPVDEEYTTFRQVERRYRSFLNGYVQAKNADDAREKMSDNTSDNEGDDNVQSKRNIVKEQLAFINLFGARMWFDLHKSQDFIDFLRQKITRKLLKIKIAQYFEEVSVTTLDLGKKLPQILNASLPWQNELGVWVDLDLEYDGVCEATVETQGIRLPTKDESERETNEFSRHGGIIDSDEADSAEEDDDIPDNVNNDLDGADIFLDEKCSNSGGPSGPGGIGLRARMLDSILKSSVLARMAETEWVKKNITGKNITLKLKLYSLKGTLVLNFPPSPSDRIWYGFRTPPQLDITLQPCFGGKSFGKLEGTISTVMRLLEKRLKREFMKVLVYPNMDDEVLSFMDHVPYSVNKKKDDVLVSRET